MIAGTFVLEDVAVHFQLPDTRDGMVAVHVQEMLGGESAKIECDPRAFAASMCLAFDFDGMEGDDMQAWLYKLAETIPFPSDRLRWIP